MKGLEFKKNTQTQDRAHISSSKGKLSVLIPCFNEETIIRQSIEKTERYLSHLKSLTAWELILINDGSTDGTLKILQTYQNESIHVLSFEHNKGRGAAIKAGFQVATGEFTITLDADLSYDLDHIQEILDTFTHQPKVAAVVVSAYMKGGTVQGVPFSRLTISRIANYILSRFFPQKLATVTCVVRGYKTEVVKKLCLLEKDKEIHLEILKKLFLKNLVVKEIPGRLVWKREKKVNSSSRKLKIKQSSKKHLLYALSIKPHGCFKYVILFLLLIGIYETAIFSMQVIKVFDPNQASIGSALWIALKKTFDHSPHTFFIALGSLILSLNSFFFFLIIYIIRVNHDEVLRHLMEVIECRLSSNLEGD